MALYTDLPDWSDPMVDKVKVSVYKNIVSTIVVLG